MVKNENGKDGQGWIGRLLCLIGMHDFRTIEIICGFGSGGTVQKVECQRCGLVTTRRG